MSVVQKYGIHYPFSNEQDDMTYLDLDKTYEDKIKSEVLHVLFTPKGQRLRDPNFGTDLIKYIFDQSDDDTFNRLKETIREDIKRYVPSVDFNDISIYTDDENENSRIVIVHYGVTKGATTEKTSVAVRI